MNNLEQIVLQDFEEFKVFFTNFLGLNANQKEVIDRNTPKLLVSDRLNYYAALEFSNENLYRWCYKPEAVNNPLAKSEESGHYFNLVLSPEHRTNLFQAEKGSELYLKLEYRAEYIARLMALIHLNHKEIKQYNQIWSRIENDKIILTTEPLSTKAHYLGYTKAEKDFKTLTTQQRKEKLKRVLFGNDLSEFSDINRRQIPEIVTLPEIYQLAA